MSQVSLALSSATGSVLLIVVTAFIDGSCDGLLELLLLPFKLFSMVEMNLVKDSLAATDAGLSPLPLLIEADRCG